MSPTPSSLSSRIRSTIRRSPVAWAHACKIHLRPYQVQIARAVMDSVLHHRGLTFVVILPRQSGKNELQAHLFAWLLYRYASAGGRIVSVSPTFKPQTLISMERVSHSLDACLGSRHLWRSSKGYVYQLGQARLQFFSGEARARVVGATADLLLSVDEAQKVSPLKFDKDFDPMTASTNATRVFWGTAWTSNTLLERERRIALQAQQRDGIQRLFYFTADDVRQLVPAYGLHVDRVIAEHGRNHPHIRSQYFCETVDAQSGMFTPARLSLIISPLPRCVLPPAPAMWGTGEGSGVGPGVGSVSPSLNPAVSPQGKDLGRVGVGHAFLLDVAGMDECAGWSLSGIAPAGLGNPGRDSTALSIVAIDLSTLETLNHPTYHVVARHSWVGENHLAVFGKLKNLAETWHPQHIVIDATGVGEGLWALLDRAFPSRLIPVKFTQTEKSEIGWRFLSIIETGRFRDHCHTDEVRLQYSHCISEILPGPLKTIRWGVPDGTRGPDGELIHDDFVLADSLVAKLDQLEWHLSTSTFIILGEILFRIWIISLEVVKMFPLPNDPITPKRPRGAPLGNHNALKHGFYAIKPEVLSRFTTDMKGDISDEIDALRNQADITMHVFAEIEHPTLGQCLAALRGISQAFETMRGLYLTQKLLYYNHTPIEQAIDELAKIPFEED